MLLNFTQAPLEIYLLELFHEDVSGLSDNNLGHESLDLVWRRHHTAGSIGVSSTVGPFGGSSLALCCLLVFLVLLVGLECDLFVRRGSHHD